MSDQQRIPIAAYWVDDEINYVFVPKSAITVKRASQLSVKEKTLVANAGVYVNFSNAYTFEHVLPHKAADEDSIDEFIDDSDIVLRKPKKRKRYNRLRFVEDSSDEVEDDELQRDEEEANEDLQHEADFIDNLDIEDEQERTNRLRREQEDEDDQSQFDNLAKYLKSKSNKKETLIGQIKSMFFNDALDAFASDPDKNKKLYLEECMKSPIYDVIRTHLTQMCTPRWNKGFIDVDTVYAVNVKGLIHRQDNNQLCECCQIDRVSYLYQVEIKSKQQETQCIKLGSTCLINVYFFGNLNRIVEIAVARAYDLIKSNADFVSSFERFSERIKFALDTYPELIETDYKKRDYNVVQYNNYFPIPKDALHAYEAFK